MSGSGISDTQLLTEAVEQVAEDLRRVRPEWMSDPDATVVSEWMDTDEDQELIRKDCALAYHWGRFIGICEAFDLTPLQALEEA